jgi:hypothetical protein
LIELIELIELIPFLCNHWSRERVIDELMELMKPVSLASAKKTPALSPAFPIGQLLAQAC